MRSPELKTWTSVGLLLSALLSPSAVATHDVAHAQDAEGAAPSVTVRRAENRGPAKDRNAALMLLLLVPAQVRSARAR
jgi:hypothetical protein